MERCRFTGADLNRWKGSPLPKAVCGLRVYCSRHGVRVKGHPLCWHTACADWLMQYDNKTILQKQLDRIQREVSNFKGVVDMWDVINEVVIMPVYRSDNAVSRICRYLGPVENWSGRSLRQPSRQTRRQHCLSMILISPTNTAI